MKRFPIFRAGRHRASSGATLEFSEEQLRQAVAAYDTALSQAPIVVGHPKDNHPAFGWVGSLSFDEATGEIVAEPSQVDPEFSELVQAGRYKNRSASWYLPDSPANPKPGTLYLRHVGFLGAQPPAVKGLGAVQFAEDQGTVEFSDASRWAWSSIAAIARNFREWVIGEKGVEAADKVVPNFLIADLDSAAKAESTEPSTTAAMPAFAEDDLMNIQQLQAEVARLTAENAALKANQRPADFAEREASIAAREAAVAAAEAKATRTTVEARIEAAMKAGRLLPAQRKHAVDFAMGLADAEASVDFGEGDAARKVTQREAYLLQIETGPKVVEFGELSAPAANGAAAPSVAEAEATLRKQVFERAA